MDQQVNVHVANTLLHEWRAPVPDNAVNMSDLLPLEGKNLFPAHGGS